MSAMTRDSGDTAPPPMPQLGIQRGYATSSQTIAATLDPCFPRSPDHQMSRSPDLFASLCLRPSARDPTPHRRFVENKSQSRPFSVVFASRIDVILLVLLLL